MNSARFLSQLSRLSLFRKPVSWPGSVPYPGARGYSAVIGLVSNHFGEVVKVRISQSDVIPTDPLKCQWTALSNVEAEQMDARLVYEMRIETYGDSAKFFKLNFDEGVSASQ